MQQLIGTAEKGKSTLALPLQILQNEKAFEIAIIVEIVDFLRQFIDLIGRRRHHGLALLVLFVEAGIAVERVPIVAKALGHRGDRRCRLGGRHRFRHAQRIIQDGPRLRQAFLVVTALEVDDVQGQAMQIVDELRKASCTLHAGGEAIEAAPSDSADDRRQSKDAGEPEGNFGANLHQTSRSRTR
ncbi:MAG: hypothetical protein R3F54_00185 [Alphaproteobacteria bacterium]